MFAYTVFISKFGLRIVESGEGQQESAASECAAVLEPGWGLQGITRLVLAISEARLVKDKVGTEH